MKVVILAGGLGTRLREDFCLFVLANYSNGSSLTIVLPRLLPTQNVTGVVELSTNILRMFVWAGRRYSVNWPDRGD